MKCILCCCNLDTIEADVHDKSKRSTKVLSQLKEHLSPEAADLYSKSARVIAQLFDAEYASIIYKDKESGIGGVSISTIVSKDQKPSERTAIHSYLLGLIQAGGTCPFLAESNSPISVAKALSNRVIFPMTDSNNQAKGLIAMASKERLDFQKTDIRVLTYFSDYLHCEINAFHGETTGNAMVLFDAAKVGWQALLTTTNWKRMTGIHNEQLLSSAFSITDQAIPASGCIPYIKQNSTSKWSFLLDLQPMKTTTDRQIWMGTIVSATDISEAMSLKLTSSSIGPGNMGTTQPLSLSDVTIGALLGKGSFGNVYRAVLQGKQIAVKILEETPLAPSDKLQEANIGERMSHPNLVNTLSSGQDTRPNGSRCSWIMMELCEKGTLWQAIECGYFQLDNSAELHNMHLQKLLRMALQIADGMRYLHENDILHGDLNCNNVLMTQDMIPKISDFGLSRVFNGSTLSTDTFGTISHQPPELLIEGSLSLASDIYSYGVILYEICTGHRAYSGLRPAQIMTEKNIDPTLKVPVSSSGFPPKEFADFVMRCTAKDHHTRPTFFEVFDWLKTFHNDLF